MFGQITTKETCETSGANNKETYHSVFLSSSTTFNIYIFFLTADFFTPKNEMLF